MSTAITRRVKLFWTAALLLPAAALVFWLFRTVSPQHYFLELYRTAVEMDWPIPLRIFLSSFAVIAVYVWLCSRTLRPSLAVRATHPGLALGIAAALVLLSPVVLGSGFLINVAMALIGVVIFAAATTLGLRLLSLPGLNLVGERFSSPLENLVCAAALGMGALALLVFMLGSAGLLWVAVLVAGIVAGSGATSLLGLTRRLNAKAKTFASETPPLGVAAAALTVVWVLLHLPIIWTPPVAYDVLEYHLAAPAQYLRDGHVSFLKENIYAAFPENGEMLYLLGMFAGGEKLRGLAASHFVLFSAWVLSIAAVYVLVKRISRDAGGPGPAIAALLYAIIPIGTELAADFYVEHFQAFFHLAALHTACAYLSELRSGVRSRFGWLVLGGIFAGFCCGVKYTALFLTLAPLLLFVPLLAMFSSSIYEALRAGGALGSWGLLAFCPWMLRNFFATGDPLYPLGVMKLRGWSAVPDRLNFFEVAHRTGSRSLNSLALVLRRILPGFSSDKHAWTDSLECGPQLFCFAVPGALAAQSAEALLLVLVFAADFALWFLLTPRIHRFLYPELGPLAVLSGLAVNRVWQIQPLRKAVFAIELAAVLIIAPISALVISDSMRPDYVAGLESPRDAARLEYHAHGDCGPPAFEAWRAVNALPAASKVLFLGDAQTFYVDQAPAYSVVFNQSLLEAALIESADARGASEALKARGITHFYINYGEWYRLDTTYALTTPPGGGFAPGPPSQWHDEARIAEGKKQLRTGHFRAYRESWPTGVFPAYMQLSAADYGKLDELISELTSLEWTYPAEVRVCEVRKLK